MEKEKSIQTSFIPKQVLSRDPRPKQPMGLFLLVSFVILIVALFFLGGAYVYRFLLTDEIVRPCSSEGGNELAGCGLEASLARQREALSEESILRFERLDKQLRRASEIIERHQTILPVLKFLETETLQSIKYTNFNQSATTIDLKGVARSYEGVALQSNVFAGNSLVKDFVFSDVNADNFGNVNFSLRINLDPSLFSYVKNLVI